MSGFANINVSQLINLAVKGDADSIDKIDNIAQHLTALRTAAARTGAALRAVVGGNTLGAPEVEALQRRLSTARSTGVGVQVMQGIALSSGTPDWQGQSRVGPTGAEFYRASRLNIDHDEREAHAMNATRSEDERQQRVIGLARLEMERDQNTQTRTVGLARIQMERDIAQQTRTVGLARLEMERDQAAQTRTVGLAHLEMERDQNTQTRTVGLARIQMERDIAQQTRTVGLARLEMERDQARQTRMVGLARLEMERDLGRRPGMLNRVSAWLRGANLDPETGAETNLLRRPILSSALRAGFAAHYAVLGAEGIANRGAGVVSQEAAFENIAGGADKAAAKLQTFQDILAGVATKSEIEMVATNAYNASLADLNTGLRVTDTSLATHLKLFIQLARLQGIDAKTASHRFTEGLSNLSSKQTEEVIKSFNADEAYKKYADDHDMDPDELEKNRVLKRAIYAQALFEQIAADASRAGKKALEAGDGIAHVVTVLGDLGDEVSKDIGTSENFNKALEHIAASLKAIAPAAVEAVAGMAKVVEFITRNPKVLAAISGFLLGNSVAGPVGGVIGAGALVGAEIYGESKEADRLSANGTPSPPQPHVGQYKNKFFEPGVSELVDGSTRTSPYGSGRPGPTGQLELFDKGTGSWRSEAYPGEKAELERRDDLQQQLDQLRKAAKEAGGNIGDKLSEVIQSMSRAAIERLGTADGTTGVG